MGSAEDVERFPRVLHVLRGGRETAYELVDDLGPAYRIVPGGSLAAPTGRVFVQFGESTDAAAQRDLLADAGFVLESVPVYAPHAAWVTPANGQVGDALRGLERLRDLTGVESVEPELVAKSARRE